MVQKVVETCGTFELKKDEGGRKPLDFFITLYKRPKRDKEGKLRVDYERETDWKTFDGKKLTTQFLKNYGLRDIGKPSEKIEFEERPYAETVL